MKTTKPESAGMSAEKLKNIDARMAEFVKDDQLPGVMTLVKRRGKVVHFGTYGHSQIGENRPISETDIFRIYSMTKPIVSIALMMLYEQGKLSLTDPVRYYIPEFGETKVCTGRKAAGGLHLVDQFPEMTVHHLLTHTSGLSYGWSFDTPVDDEYRKHMPTISAESDSLEAFAANLAKLPLVSQPGETWRYSYSTDIVGRLVEVISGQSLESYLQEHIYAPLGMVDTAFHVSADKLDRFAELYVSGTLYNPVPATPETAWFYRDYTVPAKIPSGGGGLVSTLSDYLKFANCLLDWGRYDGGRLVSRKTLEWMASNHIPQDKMPIKMGDIVNDFGFGLGFRVATSLGESRKVTSVGEYGWGGMANTYFWIDPQEELLGLMMTQHVCLEPYPVQERFRNMVYSAIED